MNENAKIEKNSEINKKKPIEKTTSHDNKNKKFMRRTKKKNVTEKYESFVSKSFEEINPEKKFDEKKSFDFYFYNIISDSSEICKKCDSKKKTFSSNNKFHDHVRNCTSKNEKKSTEKNEISKLSLIKSFVFKTIKNGLSFRSYQYASVWLRIEMKEIIETVANTKCSMNLIDEIYLTDIFSNAIISKMPAPINVRSIGNVVHENSIYFVLKIFLNEIADAKPARGQLTRKFHIIPDLKCRVLISMNILKPEKINIDLINKIMIIPTCRNLIVIIRIAPKPNAKIKKIIHVKNETIISVKTVAKVPTYLKKKILK